MKHINEDILERFILHRASFRPEETRALEEHIAACSSCRRILEFLTEIHHDLSSLGYDGRKRAEFFTGQLFASASVIPLVPFHPMPFPETGGSPYTSVMAAMTGQKDLPRFHTLAAFASPTENTVLRVTHDRKTETLRLYVQSWESEKCAHSIVSFPEFPSDFVTDEEGHTITDATDAFLHAEWSSLRPILRLKAVEFHIAREALGAANEEHPLVCTSSDDQTVRLEAYEIGTELFFSTQPTRFSRALVQPSTNQKILVYLESGNGRFTTDPATRDIVVSLYE